MITVADLRACKMKTVLHMDGPRDRKSGWWADIHQCIEHPRLRRKALYTRADRGVTVTWSVDGREWVGTLQEAVDLLNGPVLPPNDPQFVALEEMRERLRERHDRSETD